MKRISAASLMIFLTVVIPMGTRADWADMTAQSIQIPPPPRNSEVDRNDTETLLKAQQTRTAADCALGQRLAIPSVNAFWGDGRILSASEYQRAEKKIQMVARLAERISESYKKKMVRARPYEEDPRLRPCIASVLAGTKAYPSTHAAIATATGCVLARMFPEKKNQILPYADYISNLRFIIGVHHPSDVEAGKDIGRAICRLTP